MIFDPACREQKVKAHKHAVGKFTLRIQQLSAMVARLLVQVDSERVTAPEQLGTFKGLLDQSKQSIEVGEGEGGASLRVVLHSVGMGNRWWCDP